MRTSTMSRMFSTKARVAVIGAAGGIGQPLSLLLKASPLIHELALYDMVNVPGVAADLSHINTTGVVKGYGKDDIAAALKGCTAVIIPAGVPRKPNMTRDDLFNTNASIVASLEKPVPSTALMRFLPLLAIQSTVQYPFLNKC